MPITITIQTETALEAKQLVQDLAETMAAIPASDVPAVTEVATVAITAKPKNLKKEVAAKNDKAATGLNEAENVGIPSDADLISAAKGAATSTDKKKAIKALLNKFGVPNITALPDDCRVEFLQRLRSVGGKTPSSTALK